MLLNRIISLSRINKRLIMLLIDSVLLGLILLASFSIRLGYWYLPEGDMFWMILGAPILGIPIFMSFGLYRAIIRYIEFKALWSVLQAVSLYALMWGLLGFTFAESGISRSVIVINWAFSFLMIGGLRVFARYIFHKADSTNQKQKQEISKVSKVLIYGAGYSGRQLAVGLYHALDCEVCGFVDDNSSMQGMDLVGYPIISMNEVESFVKFNEVTDILLAMPSLTREKRNVILKRLLQFKVRIKSSPSYSYPLKRSSSFDEVMDLDIEDLLMRESVYSDDKSLLSITKGKIVMVTGAGGSIGSEICRQVVKRMPKIVMLLEISEYSLYEIHQELEAMCLTLKSGDKLVALPKIIPFLGSIQDERRLAELMQTWSPDIIYHAAAYKHVPMVEGNLSEGVKNNVFGTMALVKVAIEQGIERFVLISTDKAVNPTNGMGASKRVAELILQAVSAEESIVFDSIDGAPVSAVNNTQFSMVRFGNVLGSSGSVLPLFRKQINAGGPITVTHKDITRFFMTISEASQLVMHSAAMESNKNSQSKVYVLDMGEPVKIINLAINMVEMSGLRVKNKDFPGGDIEINITGLRPGEKLYEELLIANNPEKTTNPKILMASEEFTIWSELKDKLQNLKVAASNSDPELITYILKDLVLGYKPSLDISDYVYKEQNK